MTEGRKNDAGKAPWHLLPYTAIAQVVDVLGFGAAKYGPNNWQHVESARDRYFAAAQRHLVAWWDGERIDAESGLPHLAHAACSVLFLIAIEARGSSRYADTDPISSNDMEEVRLRKIIANLERSLLASEAERDALKAILEGAR